MGTNGGGGVVDGVALRRLQAILVPGWNPNPDANLFFANFCIQIAQYEFIQLYKLYLFIGGTNTRYGENSQVVRSRWGEKNITSSDVVVVSKYATFRESMKNYDGGPTNHISSQSKLQQITARHVKT